MTGDALAVVRFTVMRPLSINRKYGRGKLAAGRRGLYTTTEFKAFEQRIKFAAVLARQECVMWPRDPWLPAHVELGYELFDYGGDADGPRKALRDQCEGVLYARDNIVADGPAPLPVATGGDARVVVTVKLLAVREQRDADRRRRASETNRISLITRANRAKTEKEPLP